MMPKPAPRLEERKFNLTRAEAVWWNQIRAREEGLRQEAAAFWADVSQRLGVDLSTHEARLAQEGGQAMILVTPKLPPSQEKAS